MTSRREARRQAIDVLFQADVTHRDPRAVLAEWLEAGERLSGFARELVEGVAANREDIDELLASHAEHWTVDRMATLDRNILRVACFELLHRPDVPPGVAVNEAVETAKELSTEDSGRFVNGVLGRIAGGRRTIATNDL
ncbi:MAG TPA: transcription antitermination factor NusB [Actinomycetota bacterium]